MAGMTKQRTLYDVLGVPRTAKPREIGLAYDGFRAQQERVDSIPDPRLAAQMKVAYDTLSDPGKRAAYDQSLDERHAERQLNRPARRTASIVAGVVALVAAAIVASLYVARQKEVAAHAPPTRQQLLALGLQLTAPVGETRISGEVSNAGVALATAPDQMVTPCHAFAAGAQITVGSGDKASRAEIARADAERDVCVLHVKDPNETLAKWQMVDPRPGEKVYAAVRDDPRPAQLREGSITRAIPDAKGGAAWQVSLPPTVPNGTPLLDASGKVVGIITTPHEFGADMVVALGASRIRDALAAPSRSE